MIQCPGTVHGGKHRVYAGRFRLLVSLSTCFSGGSIQQQGSFLYGAKQPELFDFRMVEMRWVGVKEV